MSDLRPVGQNAKQNLTKYSEKPKPTELK